MSSVNATSSATAAFRALTALYEDMENDVKDIAQEIDSVVNFKKIIHDALNFLRNNDPTGFLKMLDDPMNAELKDKFGPVDGPAEKKIDRPEVSIDIPLIGKQTLVSEKSHLEYGKDQLQAWQDRLKDIGDEVGQVATKLQLRFQMKNQGKSEAFNAITSSMKQEHDDAMAAIRHLA